MSIDFSKDMDAPLITTSYTPRDEQEVCKEFGVSAPTCNGLEKHAEVGWSRKRSLSRNAMLPC